MGRRGCGVRGEGDGWDVRVERWDMRRVGCKGGGGCEGGEDKGMRGRRGGGRMGVCKRKVGQKGEGGRKKRVYIIVVHVICHC